MTNIKYGLPMLFHATMGLIIWLIAIGNIYMPLMSYETFSYIITVESIIEIITIILMFILGWWIKFEDWVRENIRSSNYIFGAFVLPILITSPIIWFLGSIFNK